MKIVNRFCLALLVWVVSSCMLSKEYKRAELDEPEKYRTELPTTSQSIQLSWREFFTDPQLQGLIEQALEKNSDVNIALKNIEQMGAAVKQSKRALMPTLGLTAGANRSWLSPNTLNGSLSEQFIGTKYMDDYLASFSLSWEIDIWGKARMQKDAAKAQFFQQTENLMALKTLLISQVAQSYYNLVALDEQLKIAQKNIAISDSTVQMMRLQFDAGLVNSSAVDEAEAQKNTAELLVPLAKQNIAIQENALSILCGEFPDAVERSGNLTDFGGLELIAVGVPANLISRRPDVKAAEQAVLAANAQTGLAKAAMYPSFTLSPQVSANSYQFHNWFDLPGSLTKTLAVNLTQPIFQRRALRTAYETAAIEQEKAVIQFRQSVLVAVGEVSDALAKYEGSTERLRIVEQKNQNLDRALDASVKLFGSGMASYLEVLIVQNNGLQNDLEAISIRTDRMNAITDLYRSVGGGIE